MSDSLLTQATQLPTQQSSTQSQSQVGPTEYFIGGVRVQFPAKAYPSQLAMMNKVIQGLKNRQNCLLESPTGSGKSLALLCSALAWQKHEMVRIRNSAADASIKDFEFLERFRKEETKKFKPSTKNSGEKENKVVEEIDLAGDEGEEGISEFQSSKRLKKDPLVSIEKSTNEEEGGGGFSILNDQEEELLNGAAFEKNEVTEKAPKIFFGTRTHKQIAQITRELRKTAYANSRSVILASREHTCVNPVVSHVSNKNEACKELLDQSYVEGDGCGWHMNAKKMGNFEILHQEGGSGFGVRYGYDLEDLVAAGRKGKSCPYYATRHLMGQADIIFCPYNYLVDPNIRKSMSIELDGQIVIFDEAHNMEDSSREAASSSLAEDELQAALKDCERVGLSGNETIAHQDISTFISTFCGWMDSEGKSMTTFDFNSEGKSWNGVEFLASMKNYGILEQLSNTKESFRRVMEVRESYLDNLRSERGGRERPAHEKLIITSATLSIVETLLAIFDYLEREGGKHKADFRLALLRSTVRKGRGRITTTRTLLSINSWCLNPAVAFSHIAETVHCIILTSGTLSPINSFQSELGTPFPIKLEASHVIDKNQVLAGVVSYGPRHKNLNGSYSSVETFDYQDELGALIYKVCQQMPHGVLCFFPSYRLLEKVLERWESTKQAAYIRVIKEIFVEPRTGNADFQEVITQFYHTIQETNSQPKDGTVTGALFLAVCRGKVSEGLDFADNNARAVICVGIPFPNYKDLQVKMKREYNDKNIQRGLLSGSEWYEIQAFRALNQALGRCIRHRFDWGAILLVDSRFAQNPRYINSLSKWVRSSVNNFESWESAERSLVEFRENMEQRAFPVTEASFSIDIDESTDLSGNNATFLDSNPPLSSSFFGRPSAYSSLPSTPSWKLAQKSHTHKTSQKKDIYAIFKNIPNMKKKTGNSSHQFDDDDDDVVILSPPPKI